MEADPQIIPDATTPSSSVSPLVTPVPIHDVSNQPGQGQPVEQDLHKSPAIGDKHNTTTRATEIPSSGPENLEVSDAIVHGVTHARFVPSPALLGADDASDDLSAVPLRVSEPTATDRGEVPLQDAGSTAMDPPSASTPPASASLGAGDNSSNLPAVPPRVSEPTATARGEFPLQDAGSTAMDPSSASGPPASASASAPAPASVSTSTSTSTSASASVPTSAPAPPASASASVSESTGMQQGASREKSETVQWEKWTAQIHERVRNVYDVLRDTFLYMDRGRVSGQR
ncbi:hypothetical protein ACRALDRAFT_1069212 [Sodiomyces alcalophilus JCM 7366]|uniref:uncharacterized protein n=1 Tax=Sodiomyces alcalophilus JCM 7366 TaxID=591952 RepID=UPI0039B5D4FB